MAANLVRKTRQKIQFKNLSKSTKRMIQNKEIRLPPPSAPISVKPKSQRQFLIEYLANRETGSTMSRVSKNCSCSVSKKQSFKQGARSIFDWFVYSNPEEAKANVVEDGSLNCVEKGNMYDYCSECMFKMKKSPESTLHQMLIRKLPPKLEQREYVLEKLDKVFASSWIDERQVLFGTKCRGLFILDTLTGKKISVPGIVTQDESDSINRNIPSMCSGIHAIAINPSRTMVAIGAGKPNESIQIYQLPSFEPLYLLEGHLDMVFAVSWIDDQTLVSGSRDRSVKVWQFTKENTIGVADTAVAYVVKFKPNSSETQHGQKVRDLVMDRLRSRLFTLSADGYVKIWDTMKLKVTSSIPLPYTNETVCIALDQSNGVVTVGSQAHITVLDPRMETMIQSFESLDEGWGVRSMAINYNLVTIGGGYGRISFYDLRASKYLDWSDNNCLVKNSVQTGEGSLIKDYIYDRHFQGMKINNAVYTLGYDFSNAKLFTAGGPLQLNLKGCYASLWE
jgi:WD repeat-containing protein 40A